jgi:hypothetical protein
MRSNKQRLIELGMVVVLLIVGSMMLSGWSIANEARTPLQYTLLQQGPPIIVVCPEGPPLCQFAKIQDAINAAPDGSSATSYIPPTEILVAPGTYEENLVITKSVILKGGDRDRVILRPKPGGGRETRAAILVVGGLTPLTVQISGFTIQQSSDQGGAIGIHMVAQWFGALIYNNRFQNSDAGISVVYSARVGIRDNIFEGGEFGGAGILVIDSAKLEITENTFLNLSKSFQPVNGIGIWSSRGRSPEGSEIVVTRNTLRNISEDGILVSNSAGVKIKENIVEGARSGTGIGVYDSSEAVTVQKNSVLKGGISIWSSSAIVTSNRVEEGRGGIQIWKGLGERAPEAQLLKNEIRRNEWGIWAERIEYVTLCQGNQVSENRASDYVTGPLADPQPSPELKQKCEGS